MATYSITISSAKIPSAQTDFPLYIDLGNLPAAFWQDVAAAGSNIRCYQADGTTPLAREVVAVNTAAKTGELYVKTNLSASSDTVIIISTDGTGGEPAYVGTYGRNSVWTNGFGGVWHLSEAGEAITDSTGNGNDGTNEGMWQDPGKLGSGRSSDGSTSYNRIVIDPIMSSIQFGHSDDMTMTAWVKPNQWAGRSEIIGSRRADSLGFAINNNGAIEGQFDDIFPTSSGTVAWGQWSHVAVVHNGDPTASTADFFINGVASGSGSSMDANGWYTLAYMYIGHESRGNSRLNGTVDEIRLARAKRSTSWLSIEYANQNDPAAFYSIAEIVSSVDVDDQRSATIKGWDTGNNQRQASIRGSDTSTSERGARIPGAYATDQAQRSAAITGQDQSAETRSATLRGGQTDVSDRTAIIRGLDTTGSDRGATIFGGVVSPQYAVSEILTEPGSRRIADVIIYPKEVETPGDSYVEYEITTNGTDWEPIQPETLYTVQNPGSDLRWRIILHASSDGKSTPSVGYISAVWTVIPSDPADDQRGATLHGYIEHFLAFDDQATAADTIIKSNKPGTISDQAAAGDATRKASEKPASDSAAAIEAARRSVRTPKTDSAAASDGATRRTGKRASDTVQATDAHTKQATRTATDTAAAADQIRKSPAKPVSDQAAASDSISKRPKPQPQDSQTAADSSYSSIGKIIADIINLQDRTPRGIAVTFADSRAASDNTAKSVASDKHEAVTTSDASRRSSTKRLQEAVTAQDQSAIKTVTRRIIEEVVGVADAVRRFFAKASTDEAPAADEISRSIGRPEADQTGASDHTIKGITKSQSETITVNDLIGRSFIKAIIEQITANDEIAKALATGTADTIITIDDVRIATAKILGDSVTLTDEAIETIRTVALRNLEARSERGRQARSHDPLARSARAVNAQSDTIKARSKR